MELINIGDTFESRTYITQKDVEIFAAISGDYNPIHLDDQYASNSIFGRKIVHGFLAASVFSRVFGTIWPGHGTIYLSQEMSFRMPVYTNNEYIAKFYVEDIDHDRHRGIIKCILETKEGLPVIQGKALLMHKVRF